MVAFLRWSLTRRGPFLEVVYCRVRELLFAQLLLITVLVFSYSLCKYESGKPEQRAIVFFSLLLQSSQLMQYRELPSSLWLCSILKRVFVQNLSYETEFNLHDNEPVGGTHFYMNGFTRRIVLTPRKKVTRKIWPILVNIDGYQLHVTDIRLFTRVLTCL